MSGSRDSLGGETTFGLVLAFGHVSNWSLESRAQHLHVVYEFSQSVIVLVVVIVVVARL